ncbi:unnamed protein product [Malus baccata var. baccata]
MGRKHTENRLESTLPLAFLFTVGFMLFQGPSGFVHQHLAPSVGIDTKSYVGSLSIFHLWHESAKTQKTQSFSKKPSQTPSLLISLTFNELNK